MYTMLVDKSRIMMDLNADFDLPLAYINFRCKNTVASLKRSLHFCMRGLVQFAYSVGAELPVVDAETSRAMFHKSRDISYRFFR